MPPRETDPNKYIPKYIKDVPLFLRNDETVEVEDTETDLLAHHRTGKPKKSNAEPRIGQGIRDEFISEDRIDVPKVVRSRKQKGVCLNCHGKHDTRDCLERPKARKNNFNNDGSGAEAKGKRKEDTDYDAKRDRWFGYDVNDYKASLEEWREKTEDKVLEKKEGLEIKGLDDGGREFDEDEVIELKELGLWDEYKKETKTKVEGEKIVRLREDKAVYLKDLKNEKVTYDPKSRMIRDDSTGYYDEKNLFVRHRTGEALKFETIEKRSAWDGNGVVGNKQEDKSIPTVPKQMEMQTTNATMEIKTTSSALKNNLTESYNCKTTQNPLSDDVPASRYLEDVLVNGHTSVFGSFYEKGKWGYRCCRQTDFNSVCQR